MFESNPFAVLSAYIPVAVMQGYIVVMVLLVIVGTIMDMKHKRSAEYFFLNAEKAKRNAKRKVGFGEKIVIAISVLLNEVATSGEFRNVRRRLSHLLTMWGFILFVVTTVILIFGYPTPATPAPTIVPQLWHIGALMLAVGGYWFWFFIRVDVSAEGLPWYRLERADLFILSLLATSTFALLWSFTQYRSIAGWSTAFLILFAISGVVLFGGVYWSKFAHMFFKPAAAFQKRVTRADGSREDLPLDYDPSDPEVQRKYPDIAKYMGKNPPNMGPGIRRERPSHY
ncbi:MAG: adenylyl-sulfate reductase [Gammaproteobacteria bacterium]